MSTHWSFTVRGLQQVPLEVFHVNFEVMESQFLEKLMINLFEVFKNVENMEFAFSVFKSFNMYGKRYSFRTLSNFLKDKKQIWTYK